MRQIAERNLRLHKWINFLSGLTFLIPVVTLLYTYTGLSTFDIIVISNVSTIGVWLFELPTSVFADTTGRKKSMVTAVVCNALAAMSILLLFNYIGFIIAALFSALYWSFWSGTGQAFLDENLRILEREHTFGRVIGHFMFMEHVATLITPLIASLLIYLFQESVAYHVLAVIDVLVALLLIILTLRLQEVSGIVSMSNGIKESFQENVKTLKKAIQNVVKSRRVLLLLLYRSFSNHVSFLVILILPILTSAGMEEWGGGIVVTLATVGLMIGTKYAYLIGERSSYHHAWVWSTVAQAALLLLGGFFLQNWIVLALLYMVFHLFEGIWRPAWNHVLVEETQGVSIATTRSIIFSLFALYTTIGKQILSLFTVQHALWLSAGVIIVANIVLARKVLALSKRS